MNILPCSTVQFAHTVVIRAKCDALFWFQNKVVCLPERTSNSVYLGVSCQPKSVFVTQADLVRKYSKFVLLLVSHCHAPEWCLALDLQDTIKENKIGVTT